VDRIDHDAGEARGGDGRALLAVPQAEVALGVGGPESVGRRIREHQRRRRGQRRHWYGGGGTATGPSQPLGGRVKGRPVRRQSEEATVEASEFVVTASAFRRDRTRSGSGQARQAVPRQAAPVERPHPKFSRLLRIDPGEAGARFGDRRVRAELTLTLVVPK